jgi:hypothetical protein
MRRTIRSRALVTDDRATAHKVRSLIARLTHQSHEIDEDFLRRIRKIKVTRKRPESKRKKGVLQTGTTASELDLERAALSNRSKSEEKRARQKRARAVEGMLAEHGIGLNSPRALSFHHKTFALTGYFEFGTHEDCERATRSLGGRHSPSNQVTRRVDVLVVDTKGNPRYLWKTYGTKMARADELRHQWGKPLIVSEYRWRNEIGH